MVIAAFALLIIIMSLRLERFDSKLVPLIMSSSVFILAVIGLGREMLAKDKSAATSAKDETIGVEDVEKEGIREYLPIGAWLAGFTLAIYLLGFLISIPVFVLAYMKSHGVRWLVAIVSAILTGALIYGVFELVLIVTLYRGLLFTLID